MSEEYITIKQATEEFHISHTILYRLKKAGKLKFYERDAPRQVLIKRSELEAVRKPRPKSI